MSNMPTVLTSVTRRFSKLLGSNTPAEGAAQTPRQASESKPPSERPAQTRPDSPPARTTQPAQTPRQASESGPYRRNGPDAAPYTGVQTFQERSHPNGAGLIGQGRFRAPDASEAAP